MMKEINDISSLKAHIIESLVELNIDFNEGFISEDARDVYIEFYSALFDDLFDDMSLIRESVCDVYTEAEEKKKVKISKAEYDAIMAKKEKDEKEEEERKARRKSRLKKAAIAATVATAALTLPKAYFTSMKIADDAGRKAGNDVRRAIGLPSKETKDDYDFDDIYDKYTKEMNDARGKYDEKLKKCSDPKQKESIIASREKELSKISKKYASYVKF